MNGKKRIENGTGNARGLKQLKQLPKRVAEIEADKKKISIKQWNKGRKCGFRKRSAGKGSAEKGLHEKE